jgi:formylglycine-generating enzyme required for sulfatase activity
MESQDIWRPRLTGLKKGRLIQCGLLGYLALMAAPIPVSAAPVAGGAENNFTIEALEMAFVDIQPGTFLMGKANSAYTPENRSPIDQTPHQVTLTQGFSLQTTEVTQKQWQWVMGNNPSKFQGENLPVETVSWDDVQSFIQKLNRKSDSANPRLRFRLPTEAEWEYAARAGTTTPFACQESSSSLNQKKDSKWALNQLSGLDSCMGAYAWYNRNSDKTTHPVAQKKANPWGLYDMHGNVWEWVQDWYGDYPEEDVIDPAGPRGGNARVRRGGGWDQFWHNCESANRSNPILGYRSGNLGFRLVKTTLSPATPPLQPATAPIAAPQSPVPKSPVPTSGKDFLGMKFVYIKPGTFLMGSPASEPNRGKNETQHQVTLTQGFYLQTTELTQGQWQAIMGTTIKSQSRDHFQGLGSNFPMYFVSWQDTQKFIDRLNQRGQGTYRLPTEAEWEYAARAGTSGPFGIGDGQNLDASQANFNGEYPYGKGAKGLNRNQTIPVASFRPNAWGLYDMHGNVWEWVQDWYDAYSEGSEIDPIGPEVSYGKIVRGGSWYYDAQFSRSATRYFFDAYAVRTYFIGFRLVKISP